jgi:2-keto-3-deoxy-L-rhamnonate aldolase RhmA
VEVFTVNITCRGKTLLLIGEKAEVAQLVEALRYKPAGRGVDPAGAIDIFH